MGEVLRRRRNTEGTEKSQISLRLTTDLLNRVDAVCKENPEEFAGRAHFVEAAISRYLDTQRCPGCGERVDRTAKVCPFCECELEAYKKLEGELNQYLSYCRFCIDQAREQLEEIDKLNQAITAHTQDNSQEIQDYLQTSPRLKGIRWIIKDTCERTKVFLSNFDRYDSYSDTELRGIKMELDVKNSVNNIRRFVGSSTDPTAEEVEKQILDYVIIIRKYGNNKHLDHVKTSEIEADTLTLQHFRLFAKGVVLEIMNCSNLLQLIDSYLQHK